LQAQFVAGGHFVWEWRENIFTIQSIKYQSNHLRIFDYFARFMLVLEQTRYFLHFFQFLNERIEYKQQQSLAIA
jgi:hypothetical protein